MVALLSIPGFDFLLSIQNCGGVHYKQVDSMLDNTLAMHSCHWMNFETRLGAKGKHFPTVCCTMLSPCVAPGNIGLNSAVDSSQW